MGVETKRDLLARQLITAVYTGIKKGNEAMLRCMPPREPKDWACFEITESLEYEKPGQYGDDRVEAGKEFRCLPEEQSAEIQEALKGLAEGDRVKIGWNHDYVTYKHDNDGESSEPQRPVTLLEKL